MTTAKQTELMQIAKRAAAYITKLNGESETFEIEGTTMTAVIDYSAEIGEDKGDYQTAPCAWIESETVNVEAVYDNECGKDDTEAAGCLQSN